jgi:SAM-dependent methyltransferase
MWLDYESSYNAALQNQAFIAWREIGAQQKARNIARVCHGIKVRSVLEVGCGTGAVLRILEAMKFAEEYACIDISLSAVQFARESCPGVLNRVAVGSALALPFRDTAFSVAILSHVIEHLADPVSAVREASRVAEIVVIEIPTERVASNFVRTRILRRPYSSSADAGHLQFWSPSSIEEFLRVDCGMRIVTRHRDLLNRETEFYGKAGLQLAKPIFKEALKSVLPDSAYSRLLTTHATFLCRKSAGHSRRTAQPWNIPACGVA